MNTSQLDNPIWHSLNSRHQYLATGNDLAKRYPPSVTPFAAAPNAGSAEAVALDNLVEIGEKVGILSVIPPVPWKISKEIEIHQFMWPSQDLPGLEPAAITLDESHIPEMLELTSLVYPAYFRPETARLGRYVGIIEESQLCAMAGVRMAMNGFQELSAICTHPDHRGRGFAGKLTRHLVHGILEDGDGAFLHTESDNPAREMYAKLGFKLHQTLPFVVFEKT